MHPLAMTGASYGPAELKVINQAFDEAWAAIAGSFEEAPAVIEGARYQLANTILKEAANGIREPGALKAAALQSFVQERRKRETLAG